MPRAIVVVLAVGQDTVARIEEAITRATQQAPRRDTIIQSFAGNGGVLEVEDVEAAIATSNLFAPER